MTPLEPWNESTLVKAASDRQYTRLEGPVMREQIMLSMDISTSAVTSAH